MKTDGTIPGWGELDIEITSFDDKYGVGTTLVKKRVIGGAWGVQVINFKIRERAQIINNPFGLKTKRSGPKRYPITDNRQPRGLKKNPITYYPITYPNP